MEKIVYLDIEFWDRFVESFPDYDPFTDRSTTKWDNYYGMYKFISSSHLKLNISAQELKKKVECDDRLSMLWKKSTGESDIMDFDADIQENKQLTTTEELNAIYLLGDDKCKGYEKFGVMTITPSSIDEIGYLFKDSGQIIKKGNEENWNFISKAKHPFNAILIVDPYLLSDTSILENNIYAILDHILPQKVSTSFDISIISNDFKGGAMNRYEMVDKKIKQIRPRLNYNMTLYYDSSKLFHDRAILTNNVFIESGAGFALFNKNGKAKNSTTVSITYPFINSSNPMAKELYQDVIHRANRIHKSTIDSIWVKGQAAPKIANSWGDGKKNRLLE